MSAFVPLNVEIEEESDDGIDDSKEIQIEEALKLYQNALKLHSLGPSYYQEAGNAYNELFKSEIFTWEESLSEAQAIERYHEIGHFIEHSEDAVTPTLAIELTGVDGTPSSLPQVLYLAYKNHGQFLLDRLRDQLSRIERDIASDGSSDRTLNSSRVALSSLKYFVEALDKDDTDLELWRLVSRIGSCLGSHRLARFCLEAVLDEDFGTFDAWAEPLGLEVAFAKEQLKPLLEKYEDEVSQQQVSELYGKHRSIISAFRKQIDPCPYLPTCSPSLSGESVWTHGTIKFIEVSSRSFASIGQALVLQLNREAQGVDELPPGISYSLVIPFDDPQTRSTQTLKTSDKEVIALTEAPSIAISRRGSLQNASRIDNPGAHSGPVLEEHGNEPRDLSLTSPNQDTFGNVSDNQPQTNGIDHQGNENGDSAKAPEPTPADTGGTISASLPTRKRSSDAAELPDSTDLGRGRSKRIKAKGTFDPDAPKDSAAEDWAKWFEQQLQMYHQADNGALQIPYTILSLLGSDSSKSLDSIRDIVYNQTLTRDTEGTVKTIESSDLAAQDLKDSLNTWDLSKSKAFLHGHDIKDVAGGVSGYGVNEFAAFLLNSNQHHSRPPHSTALFEESEELEIRHLIEWGEGKAWSSLDQIAYRWLEALLSSPSHDQAQHKSGTWYESYLWPHDLKQSVVLILVHRDQAIYSKFQGLIEEAEQQISKSNHCVRGSSDFESSKTLIVDIQEAILRHTVLVQAIFELHLDVYERITNPKSIVDQTTRILQRDRLSRWSALASNFINQSSSSENMIETNSNDLYIRFMWATVVCNSLLEPDHRDTTILCYKDLVTVLEDIEKQDPSRAPFRIELCNNAIMPEVSVEAAQKEISRLTTMDFFMGIFKPENTDPLATIESLEPLLQLSVEQQDGLYSQDQSAGRTLNTENERVSSPDSSENVKETGPDPRLLEAYTYMKQGNLHLRLFLWHKLRDAYSNIAYPPQVLVCDLRMLAAIVDYLNSNVYCEKAQRSRQDDLLRWLCHLDDHVTRILSIALSNADAFDCVDESHIRTSLEALTAVQRLAQVFALWEDTIRVGKTPAPAQINQTATRGLTRSTDKFRDMIVKIWALQYFLMKEAMSQNQNLFDTSSQELIKHLDHAHQALGLRCYCSLANKVFLRLIKQELETFREAEGLDVDMCQLMFDLYGVKISSNAIDMQDHGCVPESLDLRTAFEIMDVVMAQINRISTKDLLKSDLKSTVDKMQQVIMIPKISNSTARTFNFRLTNNYLKSPLNPYNLYRSLRGIGSLCGTPARDEGSQIAAKGWYYMQGRITLAKFRSTKRSNAASTDDLNVAKAFLRHDLEFDTDKWETWYRLGQVYDAMIEEETTWTADKLENHMDEITDLERKAIHCFSMAMAVATRYAEASFDNTSKMADLYAEFGRRVYASTREPFSMRAFKLDDHKRHYNSRALGMYQDVPFKTMQLYSAWKFASILLRRASVQKPHDWITWYTFGKVLWKMYSCSDDVRRNAKRIDYQSVIDTFTRAVEACPETRDSRHQDKPPILEPHYKLVSVTHKLVRSKQILPEEGRRILQAIPYARKAADLQGNEGWNGYVWGILKALRTADKEKWHHRMASRAAHIMYDDDPIDPRSAVGARSELSQQIFTKTMAIQVWKPDNERAGRHFVYTGRYVRFLTRLLYQLNDKMSLEGLARRIRKRTSEFVDHSGIWEEVCQAYLKVYIPLRRAQDAVRLHRTQLLYHQPYCAVTEGYAEIIFQGMDPEIFQLHAPRLETHLHSGQTSPPYLDLLREAIELKRLNNNLFKPINPFEDLIRDIYAHLWDAIIPGLIMKDAAEENRVRMRVDNILSNPTPQMAETPPPDGAGPQGGEQPKKSGARYVTAREIVRKAEAIAAKPAPTVPAKVLKPLAPAPTSESDVRPPGDAPRLAVVINNELGNDGASSVPGSVHDSADDESELSEVDDEVVDAETEAKDAEPQRHPMFPNLLSVAADTPDETAEEAGGDTLDERADGEEAEEFVEAQERIEKEGGDEGEGEGEGEPQEQIGREGGFHEGGW
ncbi:Histone transcription regulator 3 [Lecanora helva]